MSKLYKKTNETYYVHAKPAQRSEVCSLKKAINVNIDGKLFCMAHIGQAKHKNALQLCQNLNATLPLPKNLQEHYHFIESFGRLGIDTKIYDLSTKIVLDVRRLANKGRVSFFLVYNLQVFDCSA